MLDKLKAEWRLREQDSFDWGLFDCKLGYSREWYQRQLVRQINLTVMDTKALDTIPEYIQEQYIGNDRGEEFLKEIDNDWKVGQYKNFADTCKYVSEDVLPKNNSCKRVFDIFYRICCDHKSMWFSWDFWVKYLPRGVSILTNYFKEISARNGLLPIELGFIYVLSSTEENIGYVKIGKSKDPDRRFHEISPKLPFKCSIDQVFPSYFMSHAERRLHQKFDAYRAEGEWFKPCAEMYEWLDYDAKIYVELSWFSELHERLIELPEVRLAAAFDLDITFDPYWLNWKVFDHFQELYNCAGY